MAGRKHKDVEYAIDDPSGQEHNFRTFDDAAGFAVSLAASTGSSVYIDVLIFSRDGARSYGGSDAVVDYNEDPEASVFERIEVKANSEGRVA